MMRYIHICIEFKERLYGKDEELEVGKGVSVECEDPQENMVSLRAELERNDTKVNALSAEWMEKVVKMEKEVVEIERAENAQVPALARAEALEHTICVLRSE